MITARFTGVVPRATAKAEGESACSRSRVERPIPRARRIERGRSAILRCGRRCRGVNRRCGVGWSPPRSRTRPARRPARNPRVSRSRTTTSPTFSAPPSCRTVPTGWSSLTRGADACCSIPPARWSRGPSRWARAACARRCSRRGRRARARTAASRTSTWSPRTDRPSARTPPSTPSSDRGYRASSSGSSTRSRASGAKPSRRSATRASAWTSSGSSPPGSRPPRTNAPPPPSPRASRGAATPTAISCIASRRAGRLASSSTP